MQLCSEGNRSRIGAAASERCDIIVFVDPLEAGDNDNFVVVQLFTDALGVDPFEARVLIIGVVCIGTCQAFKETALTPI